MSSRKLIRRDQVRCACGCCKTYAMINRYACGCVGVEIFNDQQPCKGCTNFRGMRHSCPKC